MGIERLKIGFIGAVNSSKVTLNKLIEHDLSIAVVYGYKPSSHMVVSGYSDLEPVALKNNLSFRPFKKINDEIESIKEFVVDIWFVVGLSQLVSTEIINSARIGCVGFHPTRLPKGRGRAPIAWLVEELVGGAATFFVIDEVADAGPVLVQQEFEVNSDDTAQSVENKLLKSIEKALDCFLPELKAGHWMPVPQNEYEATEYGIRKPEDGLINWEFPAKKLMRLIKAAAPPHPASFTYHNGNQIRILNAAIENRIPIKGVVGRVLKKKDTECLVQCGKGLLWVFLEQEYSGYIKIGDRLGFQAEIELFSLKQDIKKINEKLGIE